MTSKRTTSPRPLSAQRCARVPPIIPAPTSAIFFLAIDSPSPLRLPRVDIERPWTRVTLRANGRCRISTKPVSVNRRRGAPSGFEPPALGAELHGVEGLRPDDVRSRVGARHDPAAILEPVDLEGAQDRIDDLRDHGVGNLGEVLVDRAPLPDRHGGTIAPPPPGVPSAGRALARNTDDNIYMCAMIARPNSEHRTSVAPSISRWKS